MALKFKQMTVAGNVGKDPKTREVNGKTMAAFSVAVKGPRDKEDTPTQWVDVSVWGQQVDFVTKYIKKGYNVLVQGDWSIRQYEYNGEMRVGVDINADKVQIASSPRNQEAESSDDDELPF